MIEPRYDEEFGPFGEAAIKLCDWIFPNVYKKVLIVNPMFMDIARLYKNDKFTDLGFFISTSKVNSEKFNILSSNFEFYDIYSSNAEEDFFNYRYNHVIFSNRDLSIISAWAQSEYVVVAFNENIFDEHQEWLKEMQEIDAFRGIA
jgi:hypothetical protein